jgi:hypothetical protein
MKRSGTKPKPPHPPLHTRIQQNIDYNIHSHSSTTPTLAFPPHALPCDSSFPARPHLTPRGPPRPKGRRHFRPSTKASSASTSRPGTLGPTISSPTLSLSPSLVPSLLPPSHLPVHGPRPRQFKSSPPQEIDSQKSASPPKQTSSPILRALET